MAGDRVRLSNSSRAGLAAKEVQNNGAYCLGLGSAVGAAIVDGDFIVPPLDVPLENFCDEVTKVCGSFISS